MLALIAGVTDLAAQGVPALVQDSRGGVAPPRPPGENVDPGFSFTRVRR